MIKKILGAVLLAACVTPAMSFPGMAANNPSAATAPEAVAPVVADEASPEMLEGLKKNIQARLGVAVKKVQPSPIRGLFEIVIDNEVVYVDPKGDYIVMGEIFNTMNRRNMTEESKQMLLRIDFKDLPLNDAIKTVRGKGERQIAVFSDPNCTFCKKLEANIKDMDNVTIYTFLYPVITAGSKEASANIWCSKDPVKAWHDQMVDGKVAPKHEAGCDTSVLDRNIELGSRLNVTGTPVVFVPSGQRTPGAVGLEYLEKMLSESAKEVQPK